MPAPSHRGCAGHPVAPRVTLAGEERVGIEVEQAARVWTGSFRTRAADSRVCSRRVSSGPRFRQLMESVSVSYVMSLSSSYHVRRQINQIRVVPVARLTVSRCSRPMV